MMIEKIRGAKDVVAETIEDNKDTVAIFAGTLISTVVLIPLCIWGYKEIGKIQGRGFVAECRKSGLFGSGN